MTDRTTPDVSDPLAQDAVPTVELDLRRTAARRLPPARVRRPALYLAVAAAGALLVGVVSPGEPPARAEAQLESVSIAEQLGLSAGAVEVSEEQVAGSLEQLAASRSEREAEQTAAAQAQAAADKAERDRRAAEAAAAKAAAEAAAKAAAEAEAKAAAERAAAEDAAEDAAEQESAPAAAASGSYQEYALSKLGGDGGEFSCLERLWGRESGWNPNAQNPTSTAYGIPQFLDSTWAGTGIAKTSDGYRQIDAGLIYIENRYGSPCGAWGHSQAAGWY